MVRQIGRVFFGTINQWRLAYIERTFSAYSFVLLFKDYARCCLCIMAIPLDKVGMHSTDTRKDGVSVPPEPGIKSFVITSSAIIVASFPLAVYERSHTYCLYAEEHYKNYIYTCSWKGLYLEQRRKEASCAYWPATSDIYVYIYIYVTVIGSRPNSQRRSWIWASRSSGRWDNQWILFVNKEARLELLGLGTVFAQLRLFAAKMWL
jgi:hypothetical protein